MKHVGIVTLPLWGNYGGMLQALALYSVCNRMPHVKASLLTWRPQDSRPWWRRMYIASRYAAERLLLRFLPAENKAGAMETALWKQARSFQDRWFKHTVIPESSEQQNINSYIVGSDQVWRKTYADIFRKQSFFFLDFASKKQRQSSFSYAASFGLDQWESNQETERLCTNFLRDFKAVSVREFSGVRICKEVFGVDAVQMPDPTLLASLEDYECVINSEKTRVPKAPYLASYVLDDSAEASQLLDEVEKCTGLYHQRLMSKSSARKRCDRFYCTVAQWLRYLRDCDAVVTDSYHGCVFSIIYNKPFVCLGNEGRGSARFDTLFQIFGLEDRLVTSRDLEEVLRVLQKPIDWARVNAILEAERQRGLDFLRSNLYDGASPDGYERG